MKLDIYQAHQQSILYGNGTHHSHDMFLDLDTMEMYCLRCNADRDNFENKKLKVPCSVAIDRARSSGETKK